MIDFLSIFLREVAKSDSFDHDDSFMNQTDSVLEVIDLVICSQPLPAQWAENDE